MPRKLAERVKAKISLDFKLRVKRVLNDVRPGAKPFVCPTCQSRVPRFHRVSDSFLEELDRYQHVHSIFALETANFLRYYCPACTATDKERLYALYIEMRGTAKTKLVEFAPMPALSRFIEALPWVELRTADLYNPRADDKVDLTQIPYPDDSVDAFVASHILEHIVDDRKAMSELYRILKPGGWGIAMAPIQLTLESTMEGLPIDSDGDRWKYYGQYDHVRMYSKRDFVTRLSEAGFTVEQLGIDFFGKDVFEKHGIHPRSILYVVEKPIPK